MTLLSDLLAGDLFAADLVSSGVISETAAFYCGREPQAVKRTDTEVWLERLPVEELGTGMQPLERHQFVVHVRVASPGNRGGNQAGGAQLSAVEAKLRTLVERWDGGRPFLSSGGLPVAYSNHWVAGVNETLSGSEVSSWGSSGGSAAARSLDDSFANPPESAGGRVVFSASDFLTLSSNEGLSDVVANGEGFALIICGDGLPPANGTWCAFAEAGPSDRQMLGNYARWVNGTGGPQTSDESVSSGNAPWVIGWAFGPRESGSAQVTYANSQGETQSDTDTVAADEINRFDVGKVFGGFGSFSAYRVVLWDGDSGGLTPAQLEAAVSALSSDQDAEPLAAGPAAYAANLVAASCEEQTVDVDPEDPSVIDGTVLLTLVMRR